MSQSPSELAFAKFLSRLRQDPDVPGSVVDLLPEALGDGAIDPGSFLEAIIAEVPDEGHPTSRA